MDEGSWGDAGELILTAEISGCDEIDVGVFDMSRFTGREIAGDIGLEDIVDAGGSAAEMGFGEEANMKAGGFEKGLRVIAEALSVIERAGDMETDLEFSDRVMGDGIGVGLEGFICGEELADFLDMLSDEFGIVGEFGVISKDKAVIFERCGTSGSMGQDGDSGVGTVEFWSPSLDCCLCAVVSGVGVTEMVGQGATAPGLWY